MENSEQQYVDLDEVASELGVTKGTLHYYIRTLKIETKKFPLDRRAYMLVSEFEMIKALKRRAQRGTSKESGTLTDGSDKLAA